MDRDDAEDLCRHVDAMVTNIPGQPPLLPFASTTENIAASPGPGWRSQGTNIGTGAVVKQDPVSTANDWARTQKRRLSRKDWPAWQEHARRMGLDPDEMDMGWRTVMDRPEQVQASALDTLKTVFGEAGSMAPGSPGGSGAGWRGYWGPAPGTVSGQKPANQPQPEDEIHPEDMQKQPKKKKKQLGETSGRLGVNIKTHQAPQIGNAKGQAQDANENPGFGFRTWSARMVFEMAQRLIGLYPLMKPEEILGMAIRKSGVLTSELTPEDDRMLKMAIDWAQNGAAKTNVRTGGAPGGPFRSTADSHFGNPRGTFGL